MKLFHKKEKKSKDAEVKESPKPKKGPKTFRQLVVIDGDPTPNHDWCDVFEGVILKDGSGIRVVQASWLETEVSVFEDSGCLMQIAPVRESERKVVRPASLTVKPDFILIRNQVRGPTPNSDKRNVLYGLLMGNVPSVNSLQSEYMNLERPIMFGALRDIAKRVGKDKFPLVPQNFYSSSQQMVISTDLPSVIKVSHAHAGMGKVKVNTHDDFRDIATVVALHSDYCTAEKFIDSEYGIRIQKIGNHYRVFKKVFTGSGWKSQFGGADLQEIPLTDTYKLWADECAKSFGGMDLLAVDALHGKDGKDYIIELNGTAIGFHAKSIQEDTKHVKEVVIEKLNALFGPKENSNNNSPQVAHEQEHDQRHLHKEHEKLEDSKDS
mmetsp:Transcript_28319/g.39991  ORF Transcript_28319/g.39991 Transcript_28319/m.39991 type:complete len:380 (-) Transcript_28319:12-1151(-)